MIQAVAMNSMTTAAGLNQESLPVRVGLAGTANMRDLGGYRTEQGDRVRPGLLYRSDSPHRLGGDDTAPFDRLGIRTIVDLRSYAELDRLGRPPLGPTVRAYLHAPLRMAAPADAPAGSLSADLQLDESLTLGKLYCHFVTQSGDELRTVLRLLSDEQAFPALFYCVAGKDRTGIVAAIILALLAVPDETIAADYAATADSFERFLELARLDGALGDLSGDQRVASSLLGAEAETMLSFLGWIRAEYGSVEKLVSGIGIDEATIASLRRNLLAAS
jgi:protein-tyrosine phosphatase